MNKVAGIVLCAGQGTRMKSERAKMLHDVAGVPMCCWPIGRIANIADSEVIAVIGYQGEEVKSAVLERFGNRVKFAWQKDAIGTGDAVKAGLWQVSEDVSTVIVIGSDTPLLRENTIEGLLKAQENSDAKVALFSSVYENPTGYGRIIRDPEGSVIAIVEETDASEEQKRIKEVNTGIYAFDAQFLREEIQELNSSNSQNEFYLTDVIRSARRKYGAQAVATCDIENEEVAGINDRVQLSEAEAIMRKRLNHHWMKEGVTMIDPATTYIDAEVELSADVTLYPNVMLKGRTRVMENATIESGCVVTNSVIGEGSHLFSHSVLENASLGARTKVGPFARLRPGSVLDEETKVGNFVEMKKTHLKKGAKANHFAYLGDSEIGENCNIGAGTITCNYDGFKKHKTIIGDGSFVGSNSTLVAPVEIGELAYIGAGSTVTKDVPSGALAVSRSRQENKLEYAERIRKRLKGKN